MVNTFSQLTITVPATMANLGPGFDCLGLAVKELSNTFVFSTSSAYQLIKHTDNKEDWPDSPPNQWRLEDSLLHTAVKAVYDAAQKPLPIYNVSMAAYVPLARGLGSSSTAIIAGCLAANTWLGKPFSPNQLLAIATKLEGHPDNVAPALLGGVQLCQTHTADKVEAYSLPWPTEWSLIAVVPPQPLTTAQARQAMPKHYSLAECVTSIAGMGVWVQALATKNATAFAKALGCDTLHHPYRGPLIPLYQPLMSWADTMQPHGVIGGFISGAGSTLGLVVNASQSHQLVTQLTQWLSDTGYEGIRCIPLTVSKTGGQVTH